MIEMSNIKNDRLAQETGLIFKVIMIGGGKVGKSGIMSKMVYNKFTLGSNPTIGIEFGTMTLVHDNRFFKMQVWDTETSSGNEVQTGYYTNAIGIGP